LTIRPDDQSLDYILLSEISLERRDDGRRASVIDKAVTQESPRPRAKTEPAEKRGLGSSNRVTL